MKRGHNDVDIAQRTAAPPEGDDGERQDDVGPWMEEAERMTRDWERNPFSGSQSLIGTPELRAEYVEKLAELLRESAGVQPPRQRTQELDNEPILSRAADDKFWSDPEEMKKFTRKKL